MRFKIIILSIIYCIMLMDTNTVINDFKDTVNGVENSVVSQSALSRYSVYHQTQSDVGRSDINITRLFTLHNFHKGVMFVKYSYARYDEHNFRIDGSWNIISIWHIEKINNRWIVVKIDEDP